VPPRACLICYGGLLALVVSIMIYVARACVYARVRHIRIELLILFITKVSRARVGIAIPRYRS